MPVDDRLDRPVRHHPVLRQAIPGRIVSERVLVDQRAVYPSGPFASLEAARLWVEGFESWYKCASQCFTSVCR